MTVHVGVDRTQSVGESTGANIMHDLLSETGWKAASGNVFLGQV